MTEFEAATVAYQNASLAYQSASLAYQHAGVWIAAGTLIVGLAQCALIWYGIRMMRRAADARDRGLENQRAADDQRHAEAGQRHAEAMAALADQRRALEAVIAGMETMIERTAPKGTST